MKKLISAFAISLFFIIGCQEASSVVAPDKVNSMQKQEDAAEFDISNQDSSDLPNAPGRPIIVRQ